MIPSPTDILMAFEKSLPPKVFTKLMTRLHETAKNRQKEYFEALGAQNEYIDFAIRSITNEATGTTSEYWVMRAKEDIGAGVELLVEKPDVAAPTLLGMENGFVTKDAFGSLDSDFVIPGQIDGGVPKEFQNFLKDLQGKASDGYQKLLDYCKKQQTSVPILMLRYISILLLMELKQQCSEAPVISNELLSFFSHYDHLRPAMRSPNDLDIKEATMIREIFSKKNENFNDFMTNEIYSAMKYTLLFNCFGYHNKNDAAVNGGEYIRVVGYLNNCNFFGVYHTLAHIDHSFTGNCIIEPVDESSLLLRAKSTEPIKKGEFITCSYLTTADSENVDKRQLLLLQHFGIFNQQK